MMARSTTATARTLAALSGRGRSGASVFGRFARKDKVGASCAVFLGILVFIAIFAGQLAPYDPLESDYGETMMAPSAAHLVGTDSLARDVLSRLIHGVRITLIVACVSVFAGDCVGFSWGILSGYLGGRVDLLSQRVVDVMMSFPSIILAMLLVAVFKPGIGPVIVAIAVTVIPGSTRVIRSTALSVKQRTYVDAARAIGVSPVGIMVRHVAPQCLATLLVLFSVSLGGAVFAEASLSFLGLGVPPPNPSWGGMLSSVITRLFNPPWWLMVFPGGAITITILAFNLLGDSLRDALDPRLRGKL